ncbi:hypothetical protein EDD90_7359 [Streptomyces sp. Ag109_O5-1]|uniref:hypothetical protein n=1 Tax=Streptomyces sp. Ag109_O5-1 TaxID=1938851 RepID=UPI000F4F9C52|nr:hypothetical protein [Streptomyces sp. Ag109_O5-1]RPE44129.1 hypothetical protein EDD90_7359 [Streptomyces sp. Ag109_O5-1]
MTVLTQATAAGIPGRLAPYRFTHRVDTVSLYLLETAGYAARFDGLTGDSLRQLETAQDPEAVQNHAESLYGTLESWKKAIDRFDTTVTSADFDRIRHLPDTDPRRVGYLTANTAIDRWLACREQLHAAFLDWALDLTGTVEVPEPPGPEPVIPDEGHRVPDCTGYCVEDDVCAVEVGDLGTDDGGHLVVEVYAEPGEPVKAVLFTYDLSSDATLLRTSDPAEVRRKADELYRFAGQVDRAAHVLDQLQKREAK